MVQEGQLLRAYEYDNFGNRSMQQAGEHRTTYHYNALNQLIATADNLGAEQRFLYDKRGNLQELHDGRQLTHRYIYGALNRLEEAYHFGRNQGSRYKYDGFGHRVGKVCGRLEGRHIDPNQQVADILDVTKPFNNLLERTENQNRTSFAWDYHVTSAHQDEGVYQVYCQDHLGSTIGLVGMDGNSMMMQGYDEFGVMQNDSQDYRQPFGFTGYQYDDVAGSYFAQAREYQADVGRFMAADAYWQAENIIYGDRGERARKPNPFAMEQSGNLYGYVLNNPQRYIDPTGLSVADQEVHWLSRYFQDPVAIFGLATDVGEKTWRVFVEVQAAALDSVFIQPGGRLSGQARTTFNQQNASNIRALKNKASQVSRWTRWLPVLSVGIDVGFGVYENIVNETPELIVPHAIADIAVTGSSAVLANVASAGVGLLFSGGNPIVKVVVTAITSITANFLLHQFTDVHEFGELTIREHMRQRMVEEMLVEEGYELSY